MAADRVADMTMAELRAFVETIIDQRAHSTRPQPYRQQSDRPVAEIVEAMRRNVWTPPPGAKSSLEMLREDRER